MTRWLVQATLRVRLLVALAALGLLAFGVTQLPQAPVDVLPEFAPPYVEVQTEALGLSAQEVEQLITTPLEADLLAQVAFLDEIHSESVPGLSSVQLLFEAGTDPLRARQMVQERLTEAGALPQVTKPPTMLQPLSSSSRVLMVGLTGQDLSLIEMSVLARWNIKPRLMGVPGVANVAIFGQREQQLQVQVDPERLRQNGIVLNQVIRTTANALWVSPLSFVEASTPGTGGFIDTPNQRLGVQHVLPITSPQDLEQVAVEGTDGRVIRLGDVTDVVEDHQPLIGDAVVGDAASLMLVVEKFPGADTVAVTNAVEAALDELKPGLTGMTVETAVFRPASFIESATSNLIISAVAGLLLMLLLAGAALRSWRFGVLCLVIVPLSLLVGGVVLHLAGASVNALLLAGMALAIAVVIDDAVVDGHQVSRGMRRLHGRKPGEEVDGRDGVVCDAVSWTRGPLAYATIALVAVAVPVLLVGGLTGRFLGPMVLAYLAAVLASAVVAVTVTPVLARLLWARPERAPVRSARAGARTQRRQQVAERVLQHTVRRPRLAYAVVGLLTLACLLAVPAQTERTTLPTFADRNLLIAWEGPAGVSHPEISRITAAVTGELRRLPGVRDVGGHVGRAITSDQVTDMSSGELWVDIDPAADYSRTVADIRDVVSGYPGFRAEVGTYTDDRLRAHATDSASGLVVRVQGEDWDVLRQQAAEVQRLLDRTDRVSSARIDRLDEEPTVEIEVDLAAAGRFGIKPGDARRAAATMLAGIEVGNIFEEQKVFEVIVVGAASTRGNLADVRDLVIDAPAGGQVRLGDVADVRITSSPAIIEHDSVSRRIDVVAEVSGRNLQAVVDDVKTGLAAIDFPLGYHAEVLDGAVERESAGYDMAGYAAAALVALLLLFQAAFTSWRLALLLLGLLPAAMSGGLVALAVMNKPLATTSILGLLVVAGVCTRWAALLVHELELPPEDGVDRPPLAHVVRATLERAPVVVVSAAMTAVVLLPFAVRGSLAGLELVAPVSVVVIGGLTTSLLIVLLVLPTLYLRLGPPRQVVPAPREDLPIPRQVGHDVEATHA